MSAPKLTEAQARLTLAPQHAVNGWWYCVRSFGHAYVWVPGVGRVGHAYSTWAEAQLVAISLRLAEVRR